MSEAQDKRVPTSINQSVAQPGPTHGNRATHKALPGVCCDQSSSDYACRMCACCLLLIIYHHSMDSADPRDSGCEQRDSTATLLHCHCSTLFGGMYC